MGVLSPDEFLLSIKEFCNLSNKFHDGWHLHENNTAAQESYIKKECYINYTINNSTNILKAEYVIFYNLSYGVPSFSFNAWNNQGMLLTLEQLRENSPTKVDKKEFYSIVTQQEHPLFNKPYFIVHPCQTESLLTTLKDSSKNIIVTFLSLIEPIVKLDLPLEYGL